MAHIFIDRRKNSKGKSTVNRQKFIKRVKTKVKKAVQDAVRSGKISDIVSDKKEKVNVPVKDINEPFIYHSDDGKKEKVFPGNDRFNTGDRIPRPPEGGGGGGRDGSPDGEGEDDFGFSLTREEFMEFFFEDLELPDMVKKQLATVDDFKMRRSGFSSDGTPSRLDILRSMKSSAGRKIALRNPKKKKIKKLEAEKADLEHYIANNDPAVCQTQKDRIVEIDEEIVVLKRKLAAIPFVDDVDLRYRQWTKHPVPVTQAVMFCVMDVSGSMSEWNKEMAKRFFMLLYLFLDKNYERIDLVFIRHHSSAKECDEEEFFYGRETGGTVVSTAFELMDEIITERYNTSAWNIYGCQASDGDNWGDDRESLNQLMRERILPRVQYFAYIEVADPDYNRGSESDLWDQYQDIEHLKNFNMGKVESAADIYPVFRGLFEKK
jgi:uncharacterized sporulation protein YeaH/YhbH (DUF444 family)